MSPQLGFLTNVIESAQGGNNAAESLLRRVICLAAEQAPVYDLIAMGKYLVHLGAEASLNNIGRN